MATTYEEEKKEERQRVRPSDYDYTAPVGTYYGEQGNDYSDQMRQMISQRAAELDPNRIAEQDARVQRGRSFWTGANLFANVMANAINAHGTANGAPNMTWNDAPSQKMYDTWRDADKQLRLDRKSAQDRLEALRLQDASLAAAAGDKRAAEQKHIYDMRYQQEVADAKAANDLAALREQRAYNEEQRQRQREEALVDYEKKQQISNRYSKRSSGGGGGGSKSTKSYDFPVGRGEGKTVHATNAFEQKIATDQIADELKRVMNQGKEPGDEGWASYNDGKEYDFIATNFDRIYDSNPEFRQWFDENFGDGGTAAQQEEVPVKAAGTPAVGGMKAQSAAGAKSGSGKRHWMDVPMGHPTPATPGYYKPNTSTNASRKKGGDVNDFFRQ